MKTPFLALFFSFFSVHCFAQTDYDQEITAAWGRTAPTAFFPSGLDYGYWAINQVTPLTFSGMTMNLGDVIQTGAKLNVEVSGPESFSSTSLTVDLAVGASDSLVATETFTPTEIGEHTVTYWVDGANPEEVTDNDTLVQSFQVTETEFGRDNGIMTGGITAIAGSEESIMSIGNLMEIYADDEMSSIRVQITDDPDNVDEFIYGECWLWDDGSSSFILLNITEDHLITTEENGGMIDLAFSFPISVSAGDLLLLTAGHYGGDSPPGFGWAQDAEMSTVLGFVDGFLFALFDPNTIMVRAIFDECAYINASDSIVSISCNGALDGEIWLTPDSSNYTVIWDPSDTTDFLTGLGAGTYSYTIEDTNGCSVSGSINLTEPDVLSLSAAVVNEYFGADGEIDLTIEGGTTPYLVEWTGPGSFSSTSEDLIDLEIGTYEVVVTDANGCTDSLEIVVDSELGLDSEILSDLQLYPNPTQGYVGFSEVVEYMNVYNAMGELIRTAENTQKLDLTNEPSGLYLIVIQGRTHKIQKL